MHGGECETPSNVTCIILTSVPVGFVIFYYPIISIVSEWWIARQGVAFGVITSAAGASGTVMPRVIETLLNKYGHKTTLRAIAVAKVVLFGPLIPLVRTRLPASQANSVTRIEWSFASKPVFLIHQLRECFAGSRVLSPIASLTSIRYLERSQREAGRGATICNECRTGAGSVDLRHTLR